MEMRSIVSFLVLVLVASSPALAAAKTAEDMCEDNFDSGFCMIFLSKIVGKDDIKSGNQWFPQARQKAMDQSQAVFDFLLTHENQVGKTNPRANSFCMNRLKDSTGFIKENDFGTAAQNLQDCSEALDEASGGVLRDVKDKANKAARTCRVVGDLYSHQF